MGHDKAFQLLSAYLDGELSPADRAQIEQHLHLCGDCASTLADFRALSTLLRNSEIARTQNVGPLFAKRMQQNINTLNRRGAERLGWALSAIAACFAIAGSLQLMRPADVASTAAPAAWERTAVQATAPASDDPTVNNSNNGDLAMAEWMVADLSEGSQTHE